MFCRVFMVWNYGLNNNNGEHRFIKISLKSMDQTNINVYNIDVMFKSNIFLLLENNHGILFYFICIIYEEIYELQTMKQRILFVVTRYFSFMNYRFRQTESFVWGTNTFDTIYGSALHRLFVTEQVAVIASSIFDMSTLYMNIHRRVCNDMINKN